MWQRLSTATAIRIRILTLAAVMATLATLAKQRTHKSSLRRNKKRTKRISHNCKSWRQTQEMRGGGEGEERKEERGEKRGVNCVDTYVR